VMISIVPGDILIPRYVVPHKTYASYDYIAIVLTGLPAREGRRAARRDIGSEEQARQGNGSHHPLGRILLSGMLS
jgi:hypothetical protein